MLTSVAIIRATMDNRLFDRKALNVLLAPESWRITSTWFAPENNPVCTPYSCAPPTHSHAHMELLIGLDGQGEYFKSGKAYPYEPGSIFLMDKFEEHQNSYPESFPDALHLWILVFADQVMFRLVRVQQGKEYAILWTHLVPAKKIGVASGNCILGTPSANTLPGAFRRLDIYSGIMALICAIIREGYSASEEIGSKLFQRRVIETIQTYIHETAGKGCSLEMLADMSGYSKYHFLRIFRTHTGMYLHDYINSCRLQRVEEMQKNGFYKKEIASALGFSSLSAFSRWRKSMLSLSSKAC